MAKKKKKKGNGRMGLVERLALGAPVRQPRFERQMVQLSDTERAALLAAALDDKWSDEALTRALQDEGVMVGVDTLSAWRARAKTDRVIPEPVPEPVREPVIPTGRVGGP